MVPRPQNSHSLPANPCVEQQKKRARELQHACRAGEADALRRIREHHPRCAAGEPVPAPFRLADAQLVIAREYGFASWPRLKHHIETAAEYQRPFVREASYYADRAAGLVSMHEGGLPQALATIRRRHPRFHDRTDAEIRAARFDLDDARRVYAGEHGFPSWEALLEHVAALSSGARREPFMEAFEALRAGDVPRLAALLREDPALTAARGTNGNTLLNLAMSLAPKPRRSDPLPEGLGGDRLAAVRLLLAAGADPNGANDRGSGPLHQAGYGNDAEAAELLLAAGARSDGSAHGDGGTPLAMALFWGHREAAEVLSRGGIAPHNLRIAAGMGRLDLVRAFFTPEGALTPEAGLHRAFYRPHSGFPVWQPSAVRQEILDEALVWACKSDRLAVLPFLVEQGASVNGDPYRGTPLAWAAALGRLEAARWLLAHGAEVNLRATFGGPSHGQGVTALHLAAQNGNRAMCELLVAHGADPDIKDELYNGPASGWAAHSGHTELRDYLVAHTRA